MLSDIEFNHLKTLIEKIPPGKYKLKDLYGDKWMDMKSPTTFGKKFKNAVIARNFPTVTFENRDDENHSIYSVNTSLNV